jgi:hypothetical protein
MRPYFRMATDPVITTYDLSQQQDGMVSLMAPPPPAEQPSTAFVVDEKNVRKQQKEEMDSTSIADIMEPEQSPMMMPAAADPRMQGVMPQMTAPQAGAPTGFAQPVAQKKKLLSTARRGTRFTTVRNTFGTTIVIRMRRAG